MELDSITIIPQKITTSSRTDDGPELLSNVRTEDAPGTPALLSINKSQVMSL